MPENKSVHKPPQWWEYAKETQEPTERDTQGQSWKTLRKKKKDYNPEYKINIHESTLIQINDWINKYIGEKKQISCKKEFQVIYVDALKEGSIIPHSLRLSYE